MTTAYFFRGAGIIDLQIRSRHTWYIGDAFGPVVYFNNSGTKNIHEVLGGLGLRFGNSTFYELNGMYLWKKTQGGNGSGFAGAFVMGWNYSSNFHVELPIVAKYTLNGLKERWSVDYVPHLGFHF